MVIAGADEVPLSRIPPGDRQEGLEAGQGGVSGRHEFQVEGHPPT